MRAAVMAALLGLAATACGDGATRARIEIDADPETRARARLLEVMVLTGAEQELVERRTYRIPQERELPTTVTLVPSAHERQHGFTVIASVFAEPEPVDPLAARLLLAGYTPGETTEFRIFLTAATESGLVPDDAGVAMEVWP